MAALGTPATVVCTVSSRRPDYLARTLASWMAVRGEADITFSCEPGDPASFEMCQAHGITVGHARHLGPVANTAYCLSAGFARSPFVICTEEDVLVSADVLEYFAWADETYKDDQEIAGICAYSPSWNGDPAVVARKTEFSALCWGTWADRWDQMAAEWHGLPEWGNPDAWDRNLLAHQGGRGRKFIVPSASRSQHIGEIGLNSHHGADWYLRTQARTFSEDHGPQDYREIRLDL